MSPSRVPKRLEPADASRSPSPAVARSIPRSAFWLIGILAGLILGIGLALLTRPQADHPPQPLSGSHGTTVLENAPDFRGPRARPSISSDATPEDLKREVAHIAEDLLEAGHEYRKHGLLGKAEEMFGTAAAIAPKDVESRAELIALYEQTGQDRDTLLVCQELCEIHPKNTEYWYNAGVLLARLGDLEAGLVAVRRAGELDPGNSKYRQAQQMIEEGK